MSEAKDNQEYFSVIIPAYNAEKTLSKCLGSILKQNIETYEVIVINDGSTDNTLGIIKKFQIKDSKIRCFDNCNKGVSYSRNFGIYNALYDNLLFIDADDYVGPDFLSQFLITNFKHDKFIIGCLNDHRIGKVKPELIGRETKLEEVILELDNSDLIGYLHNKCFSKSLIEKKGLVFRTDLSMCEDFLFVQSYLEGIETIYLVNSKSYYYLDTPDSLSKKPIKKTDILKLISSFHKVYSNLSLRYPSIVSHFNISFRERIINLFFIYIFKRERMEELSDYMSVSKEIKKNIRFSPVEKKHKILLKIIFVSLPVNIQWGLFFLYFNCIRVR